MFIGPVCVGKTSVSKLVAEVLGLPRVELDEIAMPYYGACSDFDPDAYNRLAETKGFVAAYRYFEPALAFAVERVVEDYEGALLDLGAGHTCFLDPRFHDVVKRALQPYRNVVLLLPDPHPACCVEVIRRRLSEDDRDGMTWHFDTVDFIRHWVESDQNRRLADHVIYTGADTQDVVARRVVETLI